MGGFKIVEDRPTPREVYNRRIYTFAAVASAGAMVFGYDGAFFGTTYARASFKTHFGITKMSAADQTSTSANITSSYLAAAFFGALFCWPVMEALGRRVAIRIASFIFVIGAVLMVAATSQIGLIYAGRAITGFAAGALTAVIPTFIAETAPPPIRGQLTGMFEIAYQAGSLVGFWINYGITKHLKAESVATFRIPMAVQLIPGGFLLIGSFFLRESPFHLLRRGKNEEALRNLTYLRMLPEDHPYIQEEVDLVRARMEEELSVAGGKTGIRGYLSGAMKELSKKHMRHRVIVTFFMFTFQNWSGAACINYYSPTLFAAIGITDTNLYTGIYGLVKAVGAFTFFLFIVDRAGRRNPWLISAAACSICLLILSIFTHSIRHHKGALSTASEKAGGNMATAFIMIYSLFWSFGGNGLPWIVSSELFPMRLRSLTGAFGACIQWLMSFASTEAFPHMVASKMGVWGTFLFFTMCCVLTFVFTFIWVPETKAIPIDAMEILFSGPVRHAAWRQKAVYPPLGMPPLPDRLEVIHEAHLRDEQKAVQDEHYEGN